VHPAAGYGQNDEHILDILASHVLVAGVYETERKRQANQNAENVVEHVGRFAYLKIVNRSMNNKQTCILKQFSGIIRKI